MMIPPECTPHVCTAPALAAAASWRDITADGLTDLCLDLQRLQLSLRAAAGPFNVFTADCGPPLRAAALLKRRVGVSMRRLRRLYEESWELSWRTQQPLTRLHAALCRWEELVVAGGNSGTLCGNNNNNNNNNNLFAAGDNDDDDYSYYYATEFMQGLEDIINDVQEALISFYSYGASAMMEEPTTVDFAHVQKDCMEAEDIPASSSSSSSSFLSSSSLRGSLYENCCGMSRRASKLLLRFIIQRCGYDVNLFFFTVVCRCMTVMFALIFVLSLSHIFLDCYCYYYYKIYNYYNNTLSSDASKTILYSSLVNNSASTILHVCMSVVQLFLLVGVGCMYLIILPAMTINISNNKSFYFPSASLCVENMLASRKRFIQRKTFPHGDSETTTTATGGDSNDDGMKKENNVHSLLVFPQRNLNNNNNNNNNNKDEEEENYMKPSQCIQSEKETRVLLTEAPSGIPDKSKVASPSSPPAKHSAKICRYLVENIEDCVCPVIIVEDNNNNNNTTNTKCLHDKQLHKHFLPCTQHTEEEEEEEEMKKGRGGVMYPLVYCNAPVTELLGYRWLTDVVGKDLKNIFELYQDIRSPPSFKRNNNNYYNYNNDNKRTSLPALTRKQYPATTTAKDHSPLVPVPPSRHHRDITTTAAAAGDEAEEKTKGGKRKEDMEKITNLKSLFEAGTEECLMLYSIETACYFDVYAMSIQNVTLPSSFCNSVVEQPYEAFHRNSSSAKYLVLLFMRPLHNISGDIPRTLSENAIRRDTGPYNNNNKNNNNNNNNNKMALLSTMNRNSKKEQRASSTGSISMSRAVIHESFVPGEARNGSNIIPDKTSLLCRHNVKAGPSPGMRRSQRRSTIKGSPTHVSIERGNTVDQITSQQLQQKLSSLACVHEVHLSSRVPASFLVNFVALMIFVNRVLKLYKRVRCHVDAVDMFVLLELEVMHAGPLVKMKTKEKKRNEKGKPPASLTSPTSPTSSSSSCAWSAVDTTEGGNDEIINSILSQNLLEYLRVCDATIHFSRGGCTLRFPYTTQERLELMGDVGSLQLSNLRGVLLFGVTATNALTDDAVAQTRGEMIYLDQYAVAEEAFSEAMRKSRVVVIPEHRPEEDNEDNNDDGDGDGDEDDDDDDRTKQFSPLVPATVPKQENKKKKSKKKNSNIMANLGTSFLHVVEEVAGSSIGSVNHLPYVFAGGHSKTAESSGGALITVVTESKTGSSDPNQTMTSEWLSASAVARPDNMFGKSYGHRFSDPMATSISCDSPLGGKVTSYYKKFLHVFLYIRENRPDIVQELLSRGHSATVVSDPSAMKRYLTIGMNIFDVVFIEWSEMLITPQIRDLITADAGKQTTMLYLLNEDTYTLPLPPATPDEAVLRIHDIGEVLTNPAVGMNVSMYIRQRRLRREMFQIRWRKSYQIVRQIGGGAFGDVYEVYLLASRGRLAMKRLFLNGASNRVLEQLNREVLIMSQLDHPNIVTFSHSSMEDNAYCIFMELCDVTLGQRLQQHSLQSSQHQQHQHHPQQQQKKITEEKEKGEQQQQQQQQQHEHIPLTRLSKTPHYHIQVVEKVNNRLDTNPDGSNKYPESLTAREIVLILRDIANGIAYIHAQGIVHRDLKPQNILFSNGVAKIGDFGSAAEENTTKPLVNMKGTLAYMSPEVLLGEPYGRPCDMWSFGCLLAEIIGLRLGHLQGLHLPALIELYKSIPPNGTLPITIGNYKGGKLQHHFGASTAQMILGAMKSAYNDSSTKHVDSPPSLRFRLASLTLKDQPLLSNHHEVTDNRFQNSMNSESARAVAYITTNSTSFLGSEKAELPESLVELLEGLFRRDPARRMTAEEVLQHPVTWDVEWMEMVLRAVEEISALDTEDATVDTSQGTETNAENGENFNLSIDSV